ncbi:MAG: TonB-dependent receptor [Desulfohalobiaceae bacterium]|nr:TonB-dependent receptor [Desulfohalobiaceae bacterium]
MAKHNIFLFCLLTMGLLIPGTTNAQTGNATMRLDEVVVTAGRLKELKREVTTHVTVIDEQEITMSAARDLGDLLAEQGIGHVNKYPGTLTSIGIRGFRTNAHGIDLEGKVIVLLDGRRIGTGNLAKIMTKNIERVEIIRGPASVQYGSAAIGGLVNVITRQGSGKPSAFVQGELGSFGHEELSAGFSGFAQGFDFSGSVNRSAMDDYDTADGDEYQNTGFDEKVNVSLNIGYEFLPKNRLGVIVNSFDAEGVGTPNYLSQNDLDDYADKSSQSYDFMYDGATPDGLFSWKARHCVGEDDNKHVDPVASNPDFWDDNIPFENNTDYQGAQAQLTWNPEKYRLTAGVDWLNYDLEQDYDPVKTEYDNPACFLLGKANYFDDRLILSGGVRYDDFEVAVKEGQGGTESADDISPQLGIAYLPGENIKLRANYAQGFRMPSAQQLASNFVSGFGTTYQGNPNLDPEKSETYEAGVDVYLGAFDASLTAFYTAFEDKIAAVSGTGGVQTWDNVGDATVSGFEGEFSYDMASLWNLNWQIKPYFTFTYLAEYEDEETNDDLLYTSEWNLSYGLMVSDYNGLTARLNFAYIGEQDIEDFESGWPAPVIEKGGFTVANVSVEKHIVAFGSYRDLSLRGEIHNLLDKDYAYVKGFPMPGRSFVFGVEYKF